VAKGVGTTNTNRRKEKAGLILRWKIKKGALGGRRQVSKIWGAKKYFAPAGGPKAEKNEDPLDRGEKEILAGQGKNVQVEQRKRKSKAFSF